MLEVSLPIRQPVPAPILSRNAFVYPPHPASRPAGTLRAGRYDLYFASSLRELREVQRLRFEVFNLELDEGLDEAYALGRDEDRFDRHCHHLVVRDRREGVVVGTYRFMTEDLARDAGGFYSAGEFDLGAMRPSTRAAAAEIGRACVHRDHRNGRVIHLLWRGIARYLMHNDKRFLFGCASVPSTEAGVGVALMDELRARGVNHDTLHLPALRAMRCEGPPLASDAVLPPLLESYLKLGAKIISAPALDLEFKVVDFLILLDRETLAENVRKHYFTDKGWT